MLALFALSFLIAAVRAADYDTSDEGSSSYTAKQGTVFKYDYVFVGGGIGSVSAAYWLSEALERAGKTVSIAVFEKEDYLGGNFRDVELIPPGVNETDGTFPLPFKAGLGALRVSQLGNGLERREMARNNLTMYMTPFRNYVYIRGVPTLCAVPADAAADDPTDPYGYGDFCNNQLPYVDYNGTECAVFRGFSTLNAQAKGDDAATSSYHWLLQDTPYLTGEADIDQFNNWIFDYGGIQPYDPAETVCVGDCPYTRVQGRDWQTHHAIELRDISTDPLNPRLNHEFAIFQEIDGVGFHGDFQTANSARSESEYQLFEWNTNSFNGYPIDGMSSLTNSMVAAAKARGVHFYTKEHVYKVSTGNPQAGYRYELKTNKRIVHVCKFLGLNLPPYYLFPSQQDDPNLVFDGRFIRGDIIDQLRATRAMQQPKQARAFKLIIQYKPGKRHWFWNLWDQTNGTYSLRSYGDSSTLVRLELVDTPFHRCAGFITAVYTDYQSQSKWKMLLAMAEESNDYTLINKNVADEFATLFPDLEAEIRAEDPVLTKGHLFNSAWHYGHVSRDDITSEDLSIAAQAPLGPSERLCMIGEAYFQRRSGWGEGAMRSAKRCIERIGALFNIPEIGLPTGPNNMPPSGTVFGDLFEILKNADGTVSDSSWADSEGFGLGGVGTFGYMPVAVPVDQRDPAQMVPNEKWGPWGPYDTPGYEENACKPTQFGIRDL